MAYQSFHFDKDTADDNAAINGETRNKQNEQFIVLFGYKM